MALNESRFPPLPAAVLVWFVIAAATMVLAGSRWLGLAGLLAQPHVGAGSGARPAVMVMTAWLATSGLAAFATWRLVRRSSYVSLLLLAALGLWLVEPGRAGDVATWRLEWGVAGVAWSGIAVFLFARLIRRQDELERRVHVEGAAIALALAVLAATAYALFEQLLPPLRAQWVAVTLLVAWWAGWLAASRRYA